MFCFNINVAMFLWTNLHLVAAVVVVNGSFNCHFRGFFSGGLDTNFQHPRPRRHTHRPRLLLLPLGPVNVRRVPHPEPPEVGGIVGVSKV